MKSMITVPIKDLDLSDEMYPKVKEPKKVVKGKPVTTYLEARYQLEHALADLFAISLSGEMFSSDLNDIVKDWMTVNLVESSIFPHSSQVFDLEQKIENLNIDLRESERQINELRDEVKMAQEDADKAKEFLLEQSQKLLTKINIAADSIDAEMKAIAEGMRGKDEQVLK